MYSGITQYLKTRDFGGKDYEPRYQLLTWIASTLVGGVQTVVIPVDKSANVLLIQIEQLSISTDGLGGIISFSDNRFNNPLFSIQNSTSYTIMPLFNYLVDNNKFSLVSNSATVLFSVGYIPISKMKKIAK